MEEEENSHINIIASHPSFSICFYSMYLDASEKVSGTIIN